MNSHMFVMPGFAIKFKYLNSFKFSFSTDDFLVMDIVADGIDYEHGIKPQQFTVFQQIVVVEFLTVFFTAMFMQKEMNEETGEQMYNVFDLSDFLSNFSTKIKEFDGNNKDLIKFYNLERLEQRLESELMESISYQGNISDATN